MLHKVALFGAVLLTVACTAASETKTGTSCTIVDGGAVTATTITCSDGTSVSLEKPEKTTDTSCSIADNGDGTSTVTCDDGTSAVVGASQVRTLTGTLAPGATLTLEHNLAGASVSASYIENGRVSSIESFAQVHNPQVGAAVENFLSSNLYSHDGAQLSDGNLVLVEYNTFHIVTPAGVAVVSKSPIEASMCGHPAVAALKDGGFVLAYFRCSTPNNLTVQKFDNTGQPAIFSGMSSHEITTATNAAGERPLLASMQAGGFGVAYMSTANTRHLLRYYATGVTYGVEITATTDNDSWTNSGAALLELSNETMLWVAKHYDNVGDDEIVAIVYAPSGAELARHDLGGTYLGKSVEAVRAPNGNVVIAYELGGPDAFAYAAFGADGALLAGPTQLAYIEPYYWTVGVFGDGDFIIINTEDDTRGTMMWNVRNDGSLVDAAPILFGGGWMFDYNDFTIFPVGPREVAVFYNVYSNPDSRMIKLTKGYLPLEIISATSARVRNWSAQTVEVTIQAVGNGR